MELYGQESKSIPQKIIINTIEIAFIIISYWILFQKGGDWVARHLHISNSNDAIARRKIIFIFNIVTFIRLAYMMFFLLKRKIPWAECMDIPFGFALYFIGFPLFVLPASAAIDGLDYFGIALFLTGGSINSVAEILRAQWKNKLVNKGKLYTKGLFKYSRHINYFGDILWVTAYAIITKNWYSISIPVFLFCLFAFYNAPKLDKYLKEKYGNDYDNFAVKTKMLIPFIF